MKDHIPILYSFIRCPWAMRARLALNLMQIEYTTIEVDLKNKPPSLLEISPKGTVPVLLLPDNTILDESLDIILWAMPTPAPEHKAAIEQLIQLNDHEFKACVNRYKYPERYAEEGLTQSEFRAQGEQILISLEQRLKQHAYLIDDQVSIADVALFPLIRQFSLVDRDWFAHAPYPNLQRWLEQIYASDFYQRAMQKT